MPIDMSENTYCNLLLTTNVSGNPAPPYVPVAGVQWTSLVLEVNAK